MDTSHTPVNHLVYSDGLAMVSVFVEALVDGEEVLQGYSSRGAVNAFSRVAGDHQITVVGEVPLTTVRRIAASVTKSEK
jgi:sigma-E factor negative regulatory protein RseB